MGFTTAIHVMLKADEVWKKDDWIGLAEAFKVDYGKYGKEKSEALRGLEKWRLFVNPYRRLHTAVNELYDDVSKANAIEFRALGRPLNKAQMRRWTDVMHQKTRVTSTLVQKGLSLKFLTPVLAESFVNLLIFLLAKPEIKMDTRNYEATIRQQIDVRVSTMPVYCQGFVKPIDAKADEFKAFKRIMDSRNDFLHGNVDPVKFGFEDVYFDKDTPLLKEGGDVFEVVRQNSLRFIEPEQLLADVDTVRRFFDFILGHVHPPLTTEIRAVLESIELGWNVATSRVGVLFPPYVVDGFMAYGGAENVFVDG